MSALVCGLDVTLKDVSERVWARAIHYARQITTDNDLGRVKQDAIE